MHITILIENPTKTTLNHSMSKRSLRENVNQRQLKPCKEGACSVASLISVVTKKRKKKPKKQQKKVITTACKNKEPKRTHTTKKLTKVQEAKSQFVFDFHQIDGLDGTTFEHQSQIKVNPHYPTFISTLKNSLAKKTKHPQNILFTHTLFIFHIPTMRKLKKKIDKKSLNQELNNTSEKPPRNLVVTLFLTCKEPTS